MTAKWLTKTLLFCQIDSSTTCCSWFGEQAHHPDRENPGQKYLLPLEKLQMGNIGSCLCKVMQMLTCLLPVLDGVWVLLGKQEKRQPSNLYPHTKGRTVVLPEELTAPARCRWMEIMGCPMSHGMGLPGAWSPYQNWGSGWVRIIT